METLKDRYRGGDTTKNVPKMIVGVFGAIAGAASVFGNTPIDVVKTRMQVNIYRSIERLFSNSNITILSFQICYV